jgi:uncharacterized protein
MAIRINLRHVEDKDLHLEGQLPVVELDIDARDEIVQATHPLEYDLEVQRLEGGLLVQGTLKLPLECQCVRCLKPFRYELEIENYSTLLALEGDEAIPIVNDCVDLTGQLREDILLEFPQHPLCDQECRGLLKAAVRTPEDKGSAQEKPEASTWAELNKLKL